MNATKRYLIYLLLFVVLFIRLDTRIQFNSNKFGILSKYVREYVKYSKKYNVYDEDDFLKLEFIKIVDNNEVLKDKNVLGFCMIKGLFFNKTRIIISSRIYIRERDYEDLKNTEEFRWLMFHELSHCFYYSEHIKDSNQLMNPYIGEVSKEKLDSMIRRYFRELQKNKLT